MDQKEKRNEEIIKLHNEGLSTQKIADKVGISKAAVYKVVTAYLDTVKDDAKPKQAKVNKSSPASSFIETGKRITNFGEFEYTGNTNEYAHKQTGQVITVKFIPAKAPDKCGHFVAI
jgi:hypothetical protein